MTDTPIIKIAPPLKTWLYKPAWRVFTSNKNPPEIYRSNEIIELSYANSNFDNEILLSDGTNPSDYLFPPGPECERPDPLKQLGSADLRYELEVKFYGKKYGIVKVMADNGNQDAATYIELDQKWRTHFGYLEAGYAANDPELLATFPDWFREIVRKWLSKGRIIYKKRWETIDSKYQDRRREEIEWLNKIESWKYGKSIHEGDYYHILNHVILPAAIFLGWADFRTRRKITRKTKPEDYWIPITIGTNRPWGLYSSMRIEVERDLFHGVTTGTKEVKKISFSSWQDDPTDYDESPIDYESSSLNSERMNQAISNYYMKHPFSNQNSTENKIEKETATYGNTGIGIDLSTRWTEDGVLDAEVMQKLTVILSRLSKNKRALLAANEYGDLRKLAEKWGVKEKTLATRKSRLVKQIKSEMSEFM